VTISVEAKLVKFLRETNNGCGLSHAQL